MSDCKKIHADQEAVQAGDLPDKSRQECLQKPSGSQEPEGALSRSWGEETWLDQIPL